MSYQQPSFVVSTNTLFSARKRELRELVENSQIQVESLQKQLQEVQIRVNDAEGSLKSAGEELQRALPFEKEVKEKNLLIGKLRHEAVILNDHLTKALRYLKKGRPEDNIDKSVVSSLLPNVISDRSRQLVTNHFLHFLALERGDPKKFQVLQIIAALLGWTDGTAPTNFRLSFMEADWCRTTRASRSGSTWCIKSKSQNSIVAMASDA